MNASRSTTTMRAIESSRRRSALTRATESSGNDGRRATSAARRTKSGTNSESTSPESSVVSRATATSNIREDKGYTYSPFSQISAHRGDAYWAQNADVSTEVTGAALREILLEIDRLQAEPPPKDELDGVKSYMSGVFVLQNSSREGIVNQLQYVERHGLSADYLRGYVARVHAVGPEQVQAMARKYIRDDEATIVVVGDREKIEKELAPFGASGGAPGE